MKFRQLLVLFTAVLTFSNSPLFSQINTALFADVLSLDSLQGFDQNQANAKALSEGLFGVDYANAIKLYKRSYVVDKYNLNALSPVYQGYQTNWFGKYSSATTANAPCSNEGFEAGSLSSWSASLGVNVNSQSYNATPTSISSGTLVSVVTTTLLDPYVGVIPGSPFTGSKVVKIGNDNVNAEVVKIAQTFPVTSTNYMYEFAYWAVMQDVSQAGSSLGVHGCTATPYMQVKFWDSGVLQTCPSFSIIAPESGTGGCAGIGPLTWSTVAAGSTTVKTSQGWQKFSVNLSGYINSNITVEVIVGDCALGGHFGYAYFDSNCGTMNLTVNSNTISMPSATVYPQAQCGSSATLVAPPGLITYTWNGPSGSGVSSNTSQTITTAVPGVYTLQMNPPGICNPPLTRIIDLSFVPPTTVTASPANLCSVGTSTSSTLSATGATSYTWSPGGSTLSSIVVTPTITTVYTVTAKTGTCVGNFTVQVNVNTNPAVNILSSNSSICPGQTATLAAFGASLYAWSPGGSTSSLITVSPPTQTTYTVIGTASTGCTGSAVTTISITAAPPVAILPTTVAPICAGTPVNLIGLAAPDFTWYPGGAVGIFQTFTPTVTTTYTAIGAANTCTNSATITVTVDPGPSMTLSANPALACPGATVTLSSSAPTATGSLTWNPGAITGTSIPVTATTSGGYSVSGTNAMGCTSTFTINPTFTTPPSLTISPASPSVCLGSSVTLTASGANNYTWQPGGLFGSAVSVAPSSNTTYTITGANAAGCTSTITTAVTVVSPPTVSSSAVPSSICNGNCFTFSNSGAISYTTSPTNLCPTSNTTYTVIGSNASGCVSNPVLVSVTVNPSPAITASANPATICAGASSTLTVTGASSYLWSTGGTGTSVVVSPSSTTVYNVTGTSALGCTAIVNVTVNVVPAPVIVINPSSASVCAGSNVALTASGGIGNSYTWTPGPLTGSLVNVSPSSNTIYTVTGSNGSCNGQNTVQVIVVPIPAITASFNPSTICAGSCATLNPSGASSYTVTGGNAIDCPTVTTAYTITGSSGGCVSAPVTTTITVNNGPILNASANPASICAGQSSTLTGTGATPLTWQPGGMTGNTVAVNPSSTTVYSLTGTNGLGCSTTQTVLVTVTPTPAVTASASPSSICSGASATLTATGATGSYLWQPGSMSGSSVFVFPTVNTNYTVTGFNGACSNTAVVSVSVITTPTVNVSASSNTVCSGGTVTLTANGLTNYQWADGPTSQIRTVTLSTTTTFSVSGDAGGCPSSNTAAITITVLPFPAITIAANPTAVCSGGSATLTATGTSTGYVWNPGSLPGGTVIVNPTSSTVYTVTGTTAAGCTATVALNLVVNPSPSMIVGAFPSTICAGNVAALTASGTAANYSWMPGALSGANVTVSPSTSTTYTVTGYNPTGCSTQSTVLVTVNPTPNISLSASSVSICAPGCSTITAFGASNYTWSTGATGNPIVVCPTTSTTYIVAGSSGGGCAGTATIAILVGPQAAITASANPSAICAGASSSLSATGGVSYIWQPGSLPGANVVVSPASTTIYTVTGINSSGCSGTAAVIVTVNPLASISATASPATICLGQSSTLTATGGTGYSWSPSGGSGSPVTVTPSVTTIYTVTGTSGSGCSGTKTLQVVVNPLPIVTASASPTSLCGGSGVTTTLTATGGTAYSWSPGSGTGSPLVMIPVVTTTYVVTATSGLGCQGTASVLVTVAPSPSPGITTSGSGTICSGSSETLTANGATTYSWSTGSSSSVIVVSPTITTVYTLFGFNGGCMGAVSRTIFVAPAPPLSVIASTTTPCVGFTVALGAITPGTHTWYPGGSTGSPYIVTPSVTTVYTVITSGGPLNCTNSKTISINPIPLPNITATANPLAVCPGGSSTLSATGAVNYTWLPGFVPGNPIVVNPSGTTTYTVGGIGSNGCPNFDTVTVSVFNVPVVAITSATNSVCYGSPLTLNAVGATNYTWFPGPQTGTSIVVNPTTTTTYTLIGNNGACSGSVTTQITVLALPPVTATALNAPVCSGSTVSLTATGAVNYVWNPTSLVGQSITDTPTTTTIYTVTGQDANGCIGQATASVSVIPAPAIFATATSSLFCAGNSNSIMVTANGANTYTWFPGNQATITIVDTPTITTTYTVYGTDSNGCIGIGYTTVSVVPYPLLTIVPSSTAVCIGSSATLTAFGASNYTWLPSGVSSSVTIESPNVPTTYTILGANASICTSSATINIFVNPLPSHVGAASLGTVTCSSPTVQLFGTCTDTNVSYFWTSAQGYTSAVQNPTPSGFWGDFTVTVTDNVTGCSDKATVNVPTDNSIPSVTASTSGSITCAVSTITLNAANTTTNPGYSWTGPAGFTSTLQSPTASAAGNYTIIVTDLSSTCTGSNIITVGTHTSVTINATIVPATCQGTLSSNNGMIMVSNFVALDKYDLVSGTTYTGTATYANAALIPVGGTITSNLANPTSTVAYTIRFFDANGCQKDTTLILQPTDCSIKSLGIAKAASSPVYNSDGSYNVTYTIVIKNYGIDALTQVTLTDNLSSTFPAPSTFTVTNISGGAQNTLPPNTTFDGITQTNLLDPVSNTLAPQLMPDTIKFTVKVKPQFFFVPYNNVAFGQAFSLSSGKVISDSSNTGLDPDPDNDGRPTNNNTPTSVTFTPFQFFGITKVGDIVKTDNNSYKVSYTVTIHNLGNDTLTNITLNDSLLGKTIKDPATYSMHSSPVSSDGHLSANSSYNGGTDIRLILPEQSKMPPNTSSSVHFVIDVVPGTVTSIANSAYGHASARVSETEFMVVSDTSNAGSNPDSNNNGVWNEWVDNVPTVLEIPNTHTLFIPEGFSPNGDNINDVFHISGLPTDGQNSLLIFNRWGNKVYSSADYDNMWDGTPNAGGTLGKNKLPQGTYYYILDMKGSGIKPITGFLVLQY